ncbi:MAG: isoleucine--tRNA ligase [Candidatus Omnitrophota bacterium]|jgi:isoleucyl-tRNA synthetase
MEYKDTLNLPKTKFSMKADLPRREPVFLKEWSDADIYSLIRKEREGSPKYILHDGPPYANGDIHLGHALNKTLKDIIIKYKTMQGYDSAYVPGWDCHGLPVEHQLFKELKINKYQIGQVEFRKKAYDYALKYVAIQKEQFMRLGIFGDWERPYLTLTPDYEEGIVRSLGEMVRKGYVYRGLKPVNWCFKCETALAEAEVEYNEHTSPSVYVKFKLDENKDYPGDANYLVIWTTTPWTLLANVAVAAHPDLVYSYIKTDKGSLILSKDLLPAVLPQIGVDKYELIKEARGADLEGLTYTHPFGLRKGRVVLADYVSREEGAGLVHTAPGHGNDDYLTGIRHKLDIIMPVDSKGKFDATAGEFKGMNVFDANSVIIEKLRNEGALLLEAKIQHSYPHCWRCKNPVIFRATKQWFINIGHEGLRDKLVKAIEEDIAWVPASGEERIKSMVQQRPDWCLSRQRYWGVPIPAVRCSDCDEVILDPAIIENVANRIVDSGSDIWFKEDVKAFIPEGFVCPKCKGDRFIRCEDILDVWFDSGVSHQVVLKKRKELEFPCALYLEGSDQHRGWFQSSLIPSMCIDGKPPFKSVLTHGFVVDGLGRKMSKSLGNVISPQAIIKDYGADILRLWVASSDYDEDIRVSSEILSRLSEAYRKIRNTARFALSNLYDFNPDTDKVAYDKLRLIDKWALYVTEAALKDVNNGYETFQFHKAYKSIYDLCNESLSMYYMDMVKGRLYTCAKDSVERRSAQTVIYEVLNILVRMMAPILVFTAEDIWRQMPKESKCRAAASVHFLSWPGENPGLRDGLPEEFLSVMRMIPDIAKLLEEKRNEGVIGSSFDAKINILTNNPKRYTFLESIRFQLCEIFKVSQVLVEKSSDPCDIAISALKADGAKCMRCWNYDFSVGGSNTHPALCKRCVTVIGEEQKS